MDIINYREWKLHVDREATMNAYANIAETYADKQCTCTPCQNFRQVGRGVFPTEVMELFESLGVDWRFPAEVYHIIRLSAGRHSYGGWFHFVGSFEGEDSKVLVHSKRKRLEFTPWPRITSIESCESRLESVTQDFQIGFSHRLALVSSAFQGTTVVQCDFHVSDVPWELDEEEPT